jgi:hypothetical protein
VGKTREGHNDFILPNNSLKTAMVRKKAKHLIGSRTTKIKNQKAF